MTSVLLALMMVCGMSISAFAADSTLVTYTGSKTDAETGTHSEEYSVTVPAILNPSDSGIVTATGSWPSNRKLTVTAPENVTLTCDIDGSTKVLDVVFADIAKAGSNTNEISVQESISIGEIADAVFGTWTGTITYTIKMSAA